MSNHVITPIELEFLLWCHYSTEKFPRIEAPAVKEAVNKFWRNGLINQDIADDDVYQLSEKGQFYINEICSTPFPKVKIVSGREE